MLTEYGFLIYGKGKLRNILENFCLHNDIDTYLESLEAQFVER